MCTHRHCIESRVQHCADPQSACTCSEWAARRSEGRKGTPCTHSRSLGKGDWWGVAVESFQSQFYVAYTYQKKIKWKERNKNNAGIAGNYNFCPVKYKIIQIFLFLFAVLVSKAKINSLTVFLSALSQIALVGKNLHSFRFLSLVI